MEVLRKYGSSTTIYFPLVDFGATDFESTPVTFASGDVQISKDSGTFANATNTPAHRGNGIYSLALSATEMQAAFIVVTLIDQTATKEWEDQSIVIVTAGNASALRPFDVFNENPGVDVLLISGDGTAANNLESYCDGTTPMPVNATQISGDATAADNLEADYDGTGYNKSNSTIGTCTTNTDMRGTDSALLASSYTAAPTAAAVADAVWDEALAGHVTAGSYGKALADIEADTNELQTNQGNWLTATGFSTHSAADVRTEMDANSTQLAAILLDTGTTIPATLSTLATAANLSTVNTAVGAIQTKTDSLTFTVAGQVDANIQYVNDVQVTGDGQTGTEWGPA